MLPWLGWRAFWFSNLRPGNGGPLLQPQGQTSVLYKVPPPPASKRQQEGSTDQQSSSTDTSQDT